MDACPNLLSYDKRDNCPAGCFFMALEPHMNQNGHINMAHLSTIPANKQLPKKLPSGSVGRPKRGRGGGLKIRIVQQPKRVEHVYVDDEMSRDSAMTSQTTSSTDSDSLDSSDFSDELKSKHSKVVMTEESFVDKQLRSRSQVS